MLVLSSRPARLAVTSVKFRDQQTRYAHLTGYAVVQRLHYARPKSLAQAIVAHGLQPGRCYCFGCADHDFVRIVKDAMSSGAATSTLAIAGRRVRLGHSQSIAQISANKIDKCEWYKIAMMVVYAQIEAIRPRTRGVWTQSDGS